MATENANLNSLRENPPKLGPQLVGRTDTSGNPIQNKILLAIPDEEFQALRPHLEFSPLTYHQSLHESTEGIQHAWFLNRGMASLVVTTHDGRSVEVGVVG